MRITVLIGILIASVATCSLASLALVLTVRRWGAADDFWWPDSGPADESVGPTGRATGRGAVHTPETDADR